MPLKYLLNRGEVARELLLDLAELEIFVKALQKVLLCVLPILCLKHGCVLLMLLLLKKMLVLS